MKSRDFIFSFFVAAITITASFSASANFSFSDKAGYERRACSTRAGDPQRIAYVLGNGDYQDLKADNLISPVIDANQMGDVLHRIGFTVRVCADRTREEMRADIEQWVADNKPSSVKQAVFFFSGHGAQAGGIEYIPGIDALRSEPSKGWTALKDIATAMKGLGATPLLLLDTHRPGGENKTGALCADKGAVTLYASTGEQAAQDVARVGGDRVMSPFSTLLSAELADDARPMNEIASHLRRTVSALVNLSNSIVQEPELCDAGGHSKAMILNPKGRSAKAVSNTR